MNRERKEYKRIQKADVEFAAKNASFIYSTKALRQVTTSNHGS